MKIFVSQVMLAEGDFNNQIDRMTCTVDTSQPLSPPPPSSPKGPMNKVTMVAAMEAMHGPRDMNCHSPRRPG